MKATQTNECEQKIRIRRCMTNKYAVLSLRSCRKYDMTLTEDFGSQRRADIDKNDLRSSWRDTRPHPWQSNARRGTGKRIGEKTTC